MGNLTGFSSATQMTTPQKVLAVFLSVIMVFGLSPFAQVPSIAYAGEVEELEQPDEPTAPESVDATIEDDALDGQGVGGEEVIESEGELTGEALAPASEEIPAVEEEAEEAIPETPVADDSADPEPNEESAEPTDETPAASEDEVIMLAASEDELDEQTDTEALTDPVAKIGEAGYATLADAVAAAPTDGTLATIVLVKDAIGDGVKVQAGQNIVFDLGGHTYTVDKTVGSKGTVTNGFQLLKDSIVTFKNGSLESNTALILIQNYSNLTLEGVTVNGNRAASLQYAVSNNFGSLTVKGNTTINASADQVAFDVWYGMSASYDEGIKITFGEDFTGTVSGKVEYGRADRAANVSNWQDKAPVRIDAPNGTFDITFANGSTGALEGANIVITAGTFISDVSAYVAEGYEWDSETHAIEPKAEELTGVAAINGTGYETLQAAIEAANGGDTIVLLEDIDLGAGCVDLPKSVTIKSQEGSQFTITSAAAQAVLLRGDGDVTFDGVNITATKGHGIQAGNDSAAYAGKLTFSNGTITVVKRGIRVCEEDTGFGIEVDGATIQSNSSDPTTMYTTGNDAIGLSLGTTDDKGYNVEINYSVIQGFSYDINAVSSGNNLKVTMTGGKAYGRAVLNVWGSNNTFTLNGVDVHGLNNQTGKSEAFSCIVDNTDARNNIYTISDCTFVAALTSAAATTSGSTASEQMIGLRGSGSTANITGSTTYNAYIDGSPVTPNSDGYDRFGLVGSISSLEENEVNLDGSAASALADHLAVLYAAGVSTKPCDDFDDGITLAFAPEVFYYRAEGSGFVGSRCALNEPYENGWLEEGEYIRLQKDVSLTKNLKSDVSYTLLLRDFTITPGEFGIEVAEGKTVTSDSDSLVSVLKAPEGKAISRVAVGDMYEYTVVTPVAKIGDVAFASLQDAVSAAAEGDEIVMVADEDLAAQVTVATSVTIDLAGHKLFNSVDIWDDGVLKSWSLISVQGGDVVLKDSVGIGGAIAKANDCYAADVRNGAFLTILSGEYNGNISAVYVHNGTLAITGGTFDVQQQDSKKGKAFEINCYDDNYKSGASTVSISGGTFKGFDPANNAAEGTGTDFTASDFTSADNGDGTYTVVPAMTVTFDSDGGSAVASQVIAQGATATEPDAPAKSGFTFQGWLLDGEEYGFSQPVDSDIELTAKWAANVAAIGDKEYTSVADAIEAADAGDAVKLLADVTELVVIAGDKKITLDLNGKTLTGYLDVYDADVDVTNGTVAGTIYANGSSTDTPYGHVTIESDATVEADYGVIIYQSEVRNLGYGATVDIKGKVEGVVWVMGNITALGENPSTINVYEGATITGDDVGIGLNGAAVVNVSGGTITGITDTGTGIEVRAGQLNVTGGIIKGQGTATSVTPSGSGTTTSGAGIAIAQHTTKLPVVVNVSGGIITGATAIYESDPQNNGDSDNVLVTLSGGTFNASDGGKSVYAADDNVVVLDGSKAAFSDDSGIGQLQLPDNKTLAKGDDGLYRLADVFTVTFDAANGFDATIVEVISGEAVAEPAAPTNGSLVFLGWYDGDTVYDFSAPVTKNLTLTAQWVDKSDLAAAVEAAQKDVDQDLPETDDASTLANGAQYVEIGTTAKLVDAIAAAREVLNNSQATQNQVDAAAKAVKDAAEAFENAIKTVAVDKSDLEAAIGEAEALLKDTKTSNDDLKPLDEYVDAEAAANLAAAITNAQTVLGDASASQAEIDAAIEALTKASEPFAADALHQVPRIKVTTIDPIDPVTYNAVQQEPAIVVRDENGNVLGADLYEVTYSNNTFAGEATVTVNLADGVEAYVIDGESKTLTANFIIDKAKVTLPTASNFTYDGTTKTGVANNARYDLSSNSRAADAGTYRVTVTLRDTDNYEWASSFGGSLTWTIAAANVTPSIARIADQTYTGSALTPRLTVTANGTTLTAGTDYDVAYANNTNVGTARATVTLKGNYRGTASATFEINQPTTAQTGADAVVDDEPADLSTATIDKIADQPYVEGKALTPSVIVKVDKVTVPASAYTVTYENNDAIGTATVTVTAKSGNKDYTGSAKTTFNIVKGTDTEWKRLAGPIALDTMNEIVDEAGFASGATVVLVTNGGFWDALTATGLAGLEGGTVLMTDGQQLSDQTAAELKKLKPGKILVAGGTAAISNDVVNAAAAAAGINPSSVQRYWGAMATDTANDIFLKNRSKFGTSAFLATSKSYHDALAAAPISYAKGMPIFLTDAEGNLTDATLKAMVDGGIKEVYIVGGTAAIPAATASLLESKGIKVVDRAAGATAIETSALVAEYGVSVKGMIVNKVGVATAGGYWDALSGASLCGKNNTVLILVNDEKSASINSFVKKHGADIATGYVFGGTAAVTDQVKSACEAVTKLAK